MQQRCQANTALQYTPHCCICTLLPFCYFLQPSRARKQAAAKPRRAPKRPAGLVNLKGLIDEGLMQPGDDVLTVEYKGTLTHASLTYDGRIRWKGVMWHKQHHLAQQQHKDGVTAAA